MIRQQNYGDIKVSNKEVDCVMITQAKKEMSFNILFVERENINALIKELSLLKKRKFRNVKK